MTTLHQISRWGIVTSTKPSFIHLDNMRTIGILLLAGCIVLSCGTNTKQAEQTNVFPYDLENPTEKYTFKQELDEVSGLGWYKNNQIVAVNDEQGKVFVYDLERKTVVEKFDFGMKGDYEGIEVVGDEIFVLESNGTLTAFKVDLPETRVLDTGIPKKTEVEGLGYDARTNRLLIAVKEMEKKGKQVKDKIVYIFDLKQKSIWQGLVIPEDALNEAEKRFDLKTKEKAADCKLSGIAVHPQTQDIYLIASDGKKLIVVNRQGEISGLFALNPQRFRQPEGICFSPEGTLYIASEGKGVGGGYLLKFEMKSTIQ